VLLDVVNHAGRHHLPQLHVHAAQRVLAQLGGARVAPGGPVIEVVVVRHGKQKPRSACTGGAWLGAVMNRTSCHNVA